MPRFRKEKQDAVCCVCRRSTPICIWPLTEPAGCCDLRSRILCAEEASAVVQFPAVSLESPKLVMMTGDSERIGVQAIAGNVWAWTSIIRKCCRRTKQGSLPGKRPTDARLLWLAMASTIPRHCPQADVGNCDQRRG